MSLRHRLILSSGLFIVFFLSTALARDLSSPSLSEYPRCAAKCMVSALQGGFCAPSNQTCICVDHEFQQNVTSCVSASCTIPEAFEAKNSSLADCGAPIRDRSQQFVTLSTTLTVVAGVFVAIRFGHILTISTIDFNIDDWLVLAAMLSVIPSAVITVYGTTANGLGRDIWTLSPRHITTITRLFYILGIFYFIQTTLAKLAIIGFYIRIFPMRETRRLLWGAFIFTSVWGVAFVFAAIFPCTPISYFWHQWDGLHKGRCIDTNAVLLSHASFSVALDLWMMAVPLWQLRSLQLHWKQKVGVAFMFSVGVFVTVVSMIRFQSLVNFGKSKNKTWELYKVSVWSTIEITVGIMCACLPTLRAVLVKAFPILSISSTQRSRGNQYYERSNSPQPMASRMGAQAVAIASTDRRHSDEEHDVETPGIIFHKTYGVRYSESDEARLVPEKSRELFGQRKQ
ncbi:hypothetical protein N0V84_005616 [Fusarium piperis]|uniref:CFEM domain-containing protein n=1 Tax=Fusarium piperis TaxID=1435070 RepID=A0A9W8WDC1_9HYPO|nr:hypothetical protein N0V84_005616 [Fusarium piperis]